MTAFLQERLNISGYVLTRIFGRQSDERERFQTLNRDLMSLQVRSAMVGRWFFMFVGVVGAVGPALIFWYGGHLVLGDELALGTIVAMVALLNNLYRPAGQLANIYVELQAAMAVFERIFEYLDMTPEVRDKPGAAVLGPAQGEVRFEHVSFTYPPPPPGGLIDPGLPPSPRMDRIGRGGGGMGGAWGGRGGGGGYGEAWTGVGGAAAGRRRRDGGAVPAEKADTAATESPRRREAVIDVSFTIEPGQLVALVGPSGAGKTTLTYLVPRFYDPDEGSVFLDGHDLRDVTQESLAQQFGIVMQETFLFHALGAGEPVVCATRGHRGRDDCRGTGRGDPRFRCRSAGGI